MSELLKKRCVVYIGDFDIRNQNVQAQLVLNNGRMLHDLGYFIIYIGINRHMQTVSEFDNTLFKTELGDCYYELPYSLSVRGVFLYPFIRKKLIAYLGVISKNFDISQIITYQAPTFATIISTIVRFCNIKKIPYIVNCADIPTFNTRSVPIKLIMTLNWGLLHVLNKKYAVGVIAVSSYIKNFYYKEGRPSVIIPPLFYSNLKQTTNHKIGNVVSFVYAGTPFVTSIANTKVEGMKDRLDIIIDWFIDLTNDGYDFTFRIIGLTKDEYCRCVPRQREYLKHNQNIVFLGKLPHDLVLENIADADFSINYRDKNRMTEAGFSTKIVESISMGTPVIINNIGDVHLYIENGKNGYILDENLDNNYGIIKMICKLDFAIRLDMKKKCLESKMFNKDNYLNILNSFLISVCKHFIDIKNEYE